MEEYSRNEAARTRKEQEDRKAIEEIEKKPKCNPQGCCTEDFDSKELDISIIDPKEQKIFSQVRK